MDEFYTDQFGEPLDEDDIFDVWDLPEEFYDLSEDEFCQKVDEYYEELEQEEREKRSGLKIIANRIKQQNNNDENDKEPECIKILNKHNISIYNDGECRSLYDVVSDIARIWDDLSEDEKYFFEDIRHYIDLIKNN